MSSLSCGAGQGTVLACLQRTGRSSVKQLKDRKREVDPPLLGLLRPTRLFREVPRPPPEGGTGLPGQDNAVPAVPLPQPVPAVRERLPQPVHGVGQGSSGPQHS